MNNYDIHPICVQSNSSYHNDRHNQSVLVCIYNLLFHSAWAWVSLLAFDQTSSSCSYGKLTLGFIFTLNQTGMSFWSHHPGPSWFSCIESLNPCSQPSYGICNENLLRRQRFLSLSNQYRSIPLSSKHAHDMETLLKDHFVLYPRCKLFLSQDRIRQGFDQDGWIGIGILNIDKQMIACCVSKALGRMKFTHETLPQGGIIDYYCVHKNYRKQGIASFMLEELMIQTAQKERFVHIFLKEGFPLWNIPPLYFSQYITRERQPPGTSCQGKDYFGLQGIGLHSYIVSYSHAEFLPLTRFAANLPYELNGDSQLSVFNYKGHVVFLCMTNLHHRTVPEGKTVGELAWAFPQTPEVPLSIQRLAVETCVDCSSYDIVLMDHTIPHDTKKAWRKDATFSWYIFNYNPGSFFNVKPFWIL